jgi:integrase
MYCSAYLFGGDVPLSFTTIDRVKNKACDDAGIERFRLHDLRHSFVSLLVNSGADIYLVASYVGHSDVEQTLNTYSHLYTNRLDGIISKLDNFTA